MITDFYNEQCVYINFHFYNEFETLRSQYLKMTEIVLVHLFIGTLNMITESQ